MKWSTRAQPYISTPTIVLAMLNEIIAGKQYKISIEERQRFLDIFCARNYHPCLKLQGMPIIPSPPTPYLTSTTHPQQKPTDQISPNDFLQQILVQYLYST